MTENRYFVDSTRRTSIVIAPLIIRLSRSRSLRDVYPVMLG